MNYLKYNLKSLLKQAIYISKFYVVLVAYMLLPYTPAKYDDQYKIMFLISKYFSLTKLVSKLKIFLPLFCILSFIVI